MSTTPKIPDLPDPGSTLESLTRFAQAVRELLQVREGRRGPALEEGVTFRDLVDLGIVVSMAGGGWATGDLVGSPGAPGLPGPPGPPGTPYVPDYTAPPTPSGLAITTLTRGAYIEWDAPGYTQGHGNAYTKVYIAQRASMSDPAPVFADAVEAGRAGGSGTIYVHQAATGAIIHAWIAFFSVDGVESVVPAGGANGVSVTIGKIDGATEILAASIGTALIANLAVDDAKMASVSAAKLLAGAIAVGEDITSTNYVPGIAGWRIAGSGAAQIPALAILGQLVAAQIDTRGLTIRDAAGNLEFKSGFTPDGYTNLVGNPSGDVGTDGWPYSARVVANLFGDGTLPVLRTQYRDNQSDQRIYVRPGESYHVYFETIPEGGGVQAGGWNIKFGFFTYDAAGGVVAAIFPAVRAAASSGARGDSGEYTIPGGIHYIRPYLFIESPSGTDLGGANGVYYRRATIRKLISATDGWTYIKSLHADRILAGTITTDRLEANAATAASNGNWTVTGGTLSGVSYNSGAVGSFTLETTGARVQVEGAVNIAGILSGSTAEYLSITVTLLVDGVQQIPHYGGYVPIRPVAGPGKAYNETVTFFWNDTLPASPPAHTFAIQVFLNWYDVDGNAFSLSFGTLLANGKFMAEENKV